MILAHLQQAAFAAFRVHTNNNTQSDWTGGRRAGPTCDVLLMRPVPRLQNPSAGRSSPAMDVPGSRLGLALGPSGAILRR